MYKFSTVLHTKINYTLQGAHDMIMCNLFLECKVVWYTQINKCIIHTNEIKDKSDKYNQPMSGEK